MLLIVTRLMLTSMVCFVGWNNHLVPVLFKPLSFLHSCSFHWNVFYYLYVITPCKCNNRFIRTKPEGVVHINLLFHKQGCNNEFISSWSHTYRHIQMHMQYKHVVDGRFFVPHVRKKLYSRWLVGCCCLVTGFLLFLWLDLCSADMEKLR